MFIDISVFYVLKRIDFGSRTKSLQRYKLFCIYANIFFFFLYMAFFSPLLLRNKHFNYQDNHEATTRQSRILPLSIIYFVYYPVILKFSICICQKKAVILQRKIGREHRRTSLDK